MSDIRITGNTVEMTVTYKAKFTSENEMLEAVKGAAELRGMVENCDNETDPSSMLDPNAD